MERKKLRVPMEAVAAHRTLEIRRGFRRRLWLRTRTLEIRRGYQKPEGPGGGGGSCSGKASGRSARISVVSLNAQLSYQGSEGTFSLLRRYQGRPLLGSLRAPTGGPVPR